MCNRIHMEWRIQDLVSEKGLRIRIKSYNLLCDSILRKKSHYFLVNNCAYAVILVKLPYQKYLCSYYQVCMCYAFVTNYVCAMTVVKLPWQKCLVEQIALTNPGLGLIEKLHKSNTNLANLTGEDKFFHTVRESLRELEWGFCMGEIR